MIDVLITEFFDEASVENLKINYNVHYETELWTNREKLKDLISNSKTIIVRNATQVDQELLNCTKTLQGIVRLGVGLDNINTKVCESRGIKVFPAIGANASSVAEYVIAMSIILLRNNLFSTNSHVYSGKWDRKTHMSSREISNKIIGIIGFGSIGQVVADKAKIMGMKVLGFDNKIDSNSSVRSKGEKVGFKTLLQNSDIVSLHCPLLSETKNLISEKEFKIMKDDAILINSSRGGVVNEKDCVNALNKSYIFGAALDTLENEPISLQTQKLFANTKNLILTPHIAGVTKDSNDRIAKFAVEKIINILG